MAVAEAVKVGKIVQIIGPVVDIEFELDRAAQQDLVGVDHALVSVEAPPWLTLREEKPPVIAPKPTFEPLD